MSKTVGYMVTWTTYGTWLQGEKKGFVKDGEGARRILNLELRIKKDDGQLLITNRI
jgi:hypothetical protein